MNGFKLTKLFRKVAIFGMAATSIFGSPLPKVKMKEGDDGEDFRLVEDEGIIASEDIVQGDWQGFSAMDDHLYRYISLENLVADDNEIGGRFWKTVKLSGDPPNLYTIHGIRSDDVEFSVDKAFDIRDKFVFDQLCQEFNNKLKVETV